MSNVSAGVDYFLKRLDKIWFKWFNLCMFILPVMTRSASHSSLKTATITRLRMKQYGTGLFNICHIWYFPPLLRHRKLNLRAAKDCGLSKLYWSVRYFSAINIQGLYYNFTATMGRNIIKYLSCLAVSAIMYWYCNATHINVFLLFMLVIIILVNVDHNYN